MPKLERKLAPAVDIPSLGIGKSAVPKLENKMAPGDAHLRRGVVRVNA